MRLPEKYRIRTLPMSGNVLCATTVDEDVVLQAYVFQDDVTLIGMTIINTPVVIDAHLNADGQLHGRVELSRQGARSYPGSLLVVQLTACWTAILGLGKLVEQETIMYPAGHGVEVDEGEAINLLGYFEWIGGLDIQWFGDAWLYYVERR